MGGAHFRTLSSSTEHPAFLRRIETSMSLLAAIKGRRGASGFGFASTAEEVTEGIDLTGKTVLITGVNSGLGLESGRVLAMRGARIIGAARSKEKAEKALATFLGKDHMPAVCELSDPASVKACVQTLKDAGVTIDVIMANAGIMALPKLNTAHGYELQFFTNHVGHFILVTGLLDQLADDGRVVILSSAAHQMAPSEGIQFDNLDGASGYSGWRAYGQSKLSNLLFAKELAKKLKAQQVAFSVHPGGIKTNLGRHMSLASRAAFPLFALFMKNIPQGSATQCWAAAHPAAAAHSGSYLADCNVAKTSKHGKDDAMAARLWDVTEGIVAKL